MMSGAAGARRRNSVGSSYSAASRRDENAPPPDGSDAARFVSGPTRTGAGAASQQPFHFSAKRPPLASSSSSLYNRKTQLPAPMPKTGSGVRVPCNTPAPPSGKKRRASSGEVTPYKSSLSKNVPVLPANLEACSDESFMRRDTESRSSLELECDMLKATLEKELKSRAEVEDRAAALERQKKAIEEKLEVTTKILSSKLEDFMEQSKELKEANEKSLNLLKEREMKIERLKNELDDDSRQFEFLNEVITKLGREQQSIRAQLEVSEANELLANQKLSELHLLLDESFETVWEKDHLQQYYASLVMDDQDAASRISRNKEEEIRKAHAEEKNEILEKNKVLQISIEELEVTVDSLEKEVKKLKEEAQQQRRQREKLEVDLDNLRQQSLVVQSSGNAGSSLKNGMADPADSTRVLSCRNNELLCSQESWRLSRKEVSDNDSVISGPVNKCPSSSTIGHGQNKEDMAEQLDGEMAQPDLSHQEHQPERSQFEHPSPTESESGEQVPPQALMPIIEVVEEKELPPVAPVWDISQLDSHELKRLRAVNHYEGKRTATDRRFWSIEQQNLYTSIYKRATIFEMKWIDWKHISKVDQFAGIKERCDLLGLEQIMSYCCPWDAELIKQFYSTVHISMDKTSITWMADGRKIITTETAWEEMFGITGAVRTQIHSQFPLSDDGKRILYSAEDWIPGQASDLSPLTIIGKKILCKTIYPRSGDKIDGHNWNLLFHVVKEQPFDIIALLFGEIDLIISGRNGTKDQLFYAPYIMGMIMRAYEYDGPRESEHNPYRPRRYKQKLDAAGHQPQGEAVHGHSPRRHSLANTSAPPTILRRSLRLSLAGVNKLRQPLRQSVRLGDFLGAKGRSEGLFTIGTCTSPYLSGFHTDVSGIRKNCPF